MPRLANTFRRCHSGEINGNPCVREPFGRGGDNVGLVDKLCRRIELGGMLMDTRTVNQC